MYSYLVLNREIIDLKVKDRRTDYSSANCIDSDQIWNRNISERQVILNKLVHEIKYSINF